MATANTPLWLGGRGKLTRRCAGPIVLAMVRFTLLSLVLVAVAPACSKSSTVEPASAEGDAPIDGEAPADAGLTVEVYSHTDLPRTGATQGLSATAFDAATRTLWALQDIAPSVVPLIANEDCTQLVPGQPIALTDRPSTDWDGEGLALVSGGFMAVTVETTPTVERFSMSGAYLGPVTLPAIYAKQRAGNKGNESLSLSPSGKYLFTANEQALEVDGAGPTKDAGTVVRIARLAADTLLGTQHAYRTEPLGPGTGGDMGVSDVTALDDDTVLVLERGYQSDYGNTVRIFRASLAGADDVSAIEALATDTAVMHKQLLVDLVSLPSQGFTTPSTQPNPLLDNYEALSLGPVLSDGRRLLFVTSDDNAKATQVARVLVLALRGL
jgi:hypothetical protein